MHHADVPLSMLRLSDNPMLACRYSMFAVEQCPKALAWMAALCLAVDNVNDAETWLIELIGAVVLVKNVRVRSGSNGPALRDTASMS